MSSQPSICNNYSNWLERLLKSPHSGISLEIYWISILCGNWEICILNTFNKKILCIQKFQHHLPRHPMNMDGICKKKEVMWHGLFYPFCFKMKMLNESESFTSGSLVQSTSLHLIYMIQTLMHFLINKL